MRAGRMVLVAMMAAAMLATAGVVEAAKGRSTVGSSRDAAASRRRSGGDERGARRGDTGSSRASRPAPRSSRRYQDEDDQDDDSYDDDDYDEAPVAPPRRGAGGYGKGAIVPVRRGKGRGPPQKSSLLSGLAATVLEKASTVQQASKGRAMELRKLVKGKISSQFERFMLQLTWPDDALLDPEYTVDVMHYLDTADDYPDEMAPTNPYRRTLRKLWARMSEKDHRTVIKSLMLVHHTALDLGPDASTRVRKHILRMRKEVNTKKQNEMYFQLARIVDVSVAGEPYVPFIKAYASYAFKRVTAFDGGLRTVAQTLKAKKTAESAATELLTTVDGIINQGVNVKIERKELLNELTRSTVQLTTSDLCELWRVYTAGLQRLVEGGFASSKGGKEGKARVLGRYAATREALASHLEQCKKAKLVRDMAKFEDNQVDDALLEQCLASSAPAAKAIKAKAAPAKPPAKPSAGGGGKASGGRAPAKAPPAAAAPSEEDEEYEQEEQEEEESASEEEEEAEAIEEEADEEEGQDEDASYEEEEAEEDADGQEDGEGSYDDEYDSEEE